MANTPYRKVRCPDELWAQLGRTVATAEETDRSSVTRRLWQLYIEQPSVRRAVTALADQANPVATPPSAAVPDPEPVATGPVDTERLKQQVIRLRGHGVEAGLTEVDAHDTIMTWLRWYSTQTDPCDYARVEAALLARARGERWQPLA